MSTNYKRILVKLSGEILAGRQDRGIAADKLMHYVDEITQVYRAGVEIAVIIGGGNIWRGTYGTKLGIDTIHGDQMGMLATMINAIALYDKLKKNGVPTRLMSRLSIHRICELYSIKKARHHLSKKRVVIIGGGTSNPGFTTDSAGSLASIELAVDLFIKGTNVDGVYAEDPEKNPNANLYDSIGLQEALDKKLGAMDMTALMLCINYALPVVLYNANRPNQLLKIVQGQKVGTFLHA